MKPFELDMSCIQLVISGDKTASAFEVRSNLDSLDAAMALMLGMLVTMCEQREMTLHEYITEVYDRQHVPGAVDRMSLN